MKHHKMKPHHYLYHIWTSAKTGYDEFAWIFFIVTIGTIIGTSLKITGGILTILLAFVLFYIAGRFHTKFEKKFNKISKQQK